MTNHQKRCPYYFATWASPGTLECALEKDHEGEHKTKNGSFMRVAFGSWINT